MLVLRMTKVIVDYQLKVDSNSLYCYTSKN